MKVFVDKRKGILDVVKWFVKNKVLGKNVLERVLDGSIKYNKFK